MPRARARLQSSAILIVWGARRYRRQEGALPVPPAGKQRAWRTTTTGSDFRPLPRIAQRSVLYPGGRASSSGRGTGRSATRRMTRMEFQASRRGLGLVTPWSPPRGSCGHARRRSSDPSARNSPVAKFSSTPGAISIEPVATGATMRPNPNGRQSQAWQCPEKAVRTRMRLARPRTFVWRCISRPLSLA